MQGKTKKLTKKFLLISSVLLCCSFTMMCISVSTPHWLETRMNFTTSFMSIKKSYEGLFQRCEDVETYGMVESQCSSLYGLAGGVKPAYWVAVDVLLVINTCLTFIMVVLSIVLVFWIKSKSLLHVFLLAFIQALPVCCSLIALSMYTSKKMEDLDAKPSAMFPGSSFGYSLILGWFGCILGLMAFVAGVGFTLFIYRIEQEETHAKFRRLENRPV